MLRENNFSHFYLLNREDVSPPPLQENVNFKFCDIYIFDISRRVARSACRTGVRGIIRGPVLEGDGGVLRRGRRPLHGDRRRAAFPAARGGSPSAGVFLLCPPCYLCGT